MFVSQLVLGSIIFLHFVGDFCFQSSWMATQKSKSLKALITHVGIYSLCLFAGLWWLQFSRMVLTHQVDLCSMSGLFGYAFLNGLVHLLIDFFTSRATSWAKRKGEERLFFSIIGFDQMLHGLTLILTVPILNW